MVKAKIVSILETDTREAAKERNASVYQAVEKFMCPVVARVAINKMIQIKVEILTLSQGFIQ